MIFTTKAVLSNSRTFPPGNVLSVSELLGNLEYILDDNCEMAKYPLGVMTTENRDVWAKLREYMVTKSQQNEQSLSEIDTALFVLCLDDDVLGTDPVDITRSFLHADGCNRYSYISTTSLLFTWCFLFALC